MMPYLTNHVANQRIDDARRQAARRRLGQEAKRSADRAVGVTDAVGRTLIALGSRMVSHHDERPAPRRAA